MWNIIRNGFAVIGGGYTLLGIGLLLHTVVPRRLAERRHRRAQLEALMAAIEAHLAEARGQQA